MSLPDRSLRRRGFAALPLSLLLALGACGGGGEPTIEVSAAASLRDALLEVVPIWESAGGAPVVLNFGPSGGLARQILAARRAGVFVSAGELELDRVEEAGLVLAGTRHVLLQNRLVVIEPAARESLFPAPFAPAMLAEAALEHLSLANPEHVPAGRYAKEWLEREGLWAALAPRVAPAVDVRAALAAVESGVARAGVVYATDAAISDRVRVIHEVPVERAPPIVYPIACVGLELHAPGQDFARFLREHPQARATFVRHGFELAAD